MKTKFYLLGLAAMLSLATCEKKEPEQQAQEYTVTFRYETSSTAYKVVQTVEEGALLTPPRDTVYREGFQLQAWSLSSDTAQLWNFATDKVNKNTILYAYYRCPVVLDYRGKTPNDTAWVSDFIPVFYHGFSAPDTAPEVNSFIFDGWYRDSSYNTTWSAGYLANPRIYAKWAPAYTVSYNTQGGIFVVPSKVRENMPLLRPEKPTHTTNENLLFWGWYKEPACTNLWDFYSDTVKENTTLYARWHSIETSGMDFPVHIISCEGKTFKTLNDDLPGLYTWTRDGKHEGNFYNSCPEGWTVPTMNELVCIQNQLHVFKNHEQYWSRELTHGNGDCYKGSCSARVLFVYNGIPELNLSSPLGNPRKIRCVRYD